MRWSLKKDEYLTGKYSAWHRWFAWYPVFLRDVEEYAWFQTVWRCIDLEGGPEPRWQYELDLGEDRGLKPDRFVQTVEELQLRARKTGTPMLYLKRKDGLIGHDAWMQVNPDGSQEQVEVVRKHVSI